MLTSSGVIPPEPVAFSLFRGWGRRYPRLLGIPMVALPPNLSPWSSRQKNEPYLN